MATIHLKRIDQDYLFETTDEAGNKMIMDIPADQGGHGGGVRPMQALLSALGGCSGVDVVMILNKQKETIEQFEMEISGERAVGKEPALWETVNVIFTNFFLSIHCVPFFCRFTLHTRLMDVP